MVLIINSASSSPAFARTSSFESNQRKNRCLITKSNGQHDARGYDRMKTSNRGRRTKTETRIANGDDDFFQMPTIVYTTSSFSDDGAGSFENNNNENEENLKFRTYTLHVKSGEKTSNEWEAPLALNVCIVGTDGRCLMERIDAFTADGYERFTFPGKTDIITFRAREIGKPTALMVSCDGKHVKSWTLESISILNSFDKNPEDTQICFPTKYYESDVVKAGALELRPGMLKKKSKEQIEYERLLSLQNYDAYKMRLFCFTAGIIAAGFTFEFTNGNVENAQAFASGGLIGVLYMQMLEKCIDSFFSNEEENNNIKGGSFISSESLLANVKRGIDIVIGSTPARFSMIAYFGYLAVQTFGAEHCLGWSVLGFFSYKIAIFPATFSHFGEEKIGGYEAIPIPIVVDRSPVDGNSIKKA